MAKGKGTTSSKKNYTTTKKIGTKVSKVNQGVMPNPTVGNTSGKKRGGC